MSGLLFCSSGAECSELLIRDYFTEVNIPFYPLSTEKRNHSSMCWDLLSCCNLEDSDSVH